jgi:ABC-2 type transport system ATP-binding protein
MIELNNLSKRFGDVTAVNQVSLKVNQGEWYLFVGPNGAGKTTTFRMLAGLMPPSEGTIIVNGYDAVRQSRNLKRLIGFLPEKAFLYPYLSGREYLSFAAQMQGVASPRRKKRIDELLELIDFTRESEELITTYSSGMRKKLSLCAVLLHDPPVLLLDEPTSDLDPRTSNLVRNLLHQLCRQGTTIFMSTHIFGITEHLCDRVGILDRGRLILEGDMQLFQDRFPGKSFEQIFLSLTGSYDGERLSRFLGETGKVAG